MIKLNDMLKISTVKDSEGYTYGIYNDRKPMYGLYVKPKKNTLLDDIEIMAKRMFKLEKDAENYSHEARVETLLALEEFYKRYDKNSSDSMVKAWVYKVVKRKLKDTAKASKSNIYTYDNKEKIFFINNILSMQKLEEDSNGEFENLECEIYDKYKPSETSSEFVKWLHNSKEELLTKRQIDFLNNDMIINNKSNTSRMRKNIYNKIANEYGECQLQDFKQKNKEIMNTKINKLLDSFDNDEFEEFIFECNKQGDYIYGEIIDYIYKEIDFNSLKHFTTCLDEGRYIPNEVKYKIINCLVELLEKNSHI